MHGRMPSHARLHGITCASLFAIMQFAASCPCLSSLPCPALFSAKQEQGRQERVAARQEEDARHLAARQGEGIGDGRLMTQAAGAAGRLMAHVRQVQQGVFENLQNLPAIFQKQGSCVTGGGEAVAAQAEMEGLMGEGTTLVVDRYSFSGIAFSAAKGLDVHWCKSTEVGLPAPDVVIYLDIDPQHAAERGGYGGERYEKVEFQQRVAQHFHALKDDTWVVRTFLPL
ncbi:unnamed protein product [Closterium sp. NIES-65]|nr:unnamed protein product [Closterium sp. NIES-65]